MTYKNLEKAKAWRKAYNQVHREEKKAYYEAHREEIRVRQKAYHKAHYVAHHREIRAKQKDRRDHAWYLAHKEEQITKSKAYYYSHREVQQAKQRAHYLQLRLEVLVHYGGVCACCGERHYEFLSIDHIDGGGKAHRRVIGTSGKSIIYWLVKNDYPEGFQVLCHNCNMAKGFYGVCPHQLERIN